MYGFHVDGLIITRPRFLSSCLSPPSRHSYTRENTRNNRLTGTWRVRGGAGARKDFSLADSVDILETNSEERSDSDDESNNELGNNEFNALSQSNVAIATVKGVWQKTPPLTRAYIAASSTLTILSWLFNSNRWPSFLSLDWNSIILRLQLWRPVTSFLYFGPFGLSYALTLQFVWQYMAQIERFYYDQPERYLVLLSFGASSLLAAYSVLGISTQFLGHNLSTYLVYIWARLFEGVSVNMMGLTTLPAEMLPWFFCAQTMLIDGVLPVADLLGIAAGHLYLYGENNKMLEPPQFLKDVMSSPPMKKLYRPFKHFVE